MAERITKKKLQRKQKEKKGKKRGSKKSHSQYKRKIGKWEKQRGGYENIKERNEVKATARFRRNERLERRKDNEKK